jgi:hypothetical protein
VQDVLVAVTVRNTQIQLLPFLDASEFWINQLVEFFNVVDFEIAGYEMPRVTTELHVHATNSVIAYDHDTLVPESRLKLRYIDNLHYLHASGNHFSAW